MVAASAIVGSATEPMIPALLKPLLDRGFQQGQLEIWTVPASLLLLFGVRGLTGYISQTVALIGASGSGKTTLVNFLTRFVDINAGQVCLDEHELRQWQLTSFRAQFSHVSEQVVMINDTVAANLALGLPSSTPNDASC